MSGRGIRCWDGVRRSRLAWRSVIGAGFALPRDAGQRSAFQAVPALFRNRRYAVSRPAAAMPVWRPAVPFQLRRRAGLGVPDGPFPAAPKPLTRQSLAPVSGWSLY